MFCRGIWINWLDRFDSTTRKSAMYPAGHPMLQESIKGLRAAADEWLNVEPKLVIAFTPDTIRLDGKPVKEKDAMWQSIADYMHRRGLLALSIDRGVTDKELSCLMDAIKDTPEVIAESGGVAQRLRDCAHIKVRESDYRALLASSRSPAAADPARGRRILGLHLQRGDGA